MSEHPVPLEQNPPPHQQTARERRARRYPWSDQDLEALRRLCEQQLDDDEIASRLGRTPRAVRTMILRLGGQRLRDPFRPWTEAELETAVRLHTAGAICAVIAQSLPGRTPVAVFRKLCRLVGPAPSSEAKRSWRAAKRQRKPAEIAAPAGAAVRIDVAASPVTASALPAAPPPPRVATPAAPPPAPRPPLLPIPAPLDAMVRWLRSRDFVVLRNADGWRIDHHRLRDDDALVAFVNLRRARLHLPPFALAEPRIMPAAIASQVVRGRRWGRPLQTARTV